MDESTSDNSPLNLLDSSNSRASVSTLERPNNETVEKLSRCLREFESENLELKRAIPRLKDAKGDDITEWAIKIINELEEERRKHNETQQNLAMLTHRFREFRDNAAEKTQKGAKTIDDLRRQAEEYEEENQRIRDQLRDDQSQIFNLRRRLDDVPEHGDGGQQSPEENSDENLRACLEHFDRRSDTEEQESGHSTQRRLRHQLQQSLNIISFLFEKHRSLANSVGHLLICHGNTQDVSLLGKINAMKLDLNQSMEICKRKFEELQSAPTSAESSIHESIDRAEPLAKNCTKCKLLENERDALKAQLNNEIKSKERFLEKGEVAERNLREARRNIEELEIERRMKECQEEGRNKDERFKKKSKELREVAGHTRTLRQQNLELDTKNENILNAVQRLKEIHADEVNAKDIEVQRQYASVEYLEQRCRELEEQFMNEKERKYSTKTKAFRRLLMQYGHYLDSSMEYETLVERSNRILQDKISDGQRSCSSSSNQPTIHQQNPSAHRHNGKRE
uniref:Uncharacterized protein n=1 Tax=Globodera rostochiensis TaxID=31243 RepID=A0A914IHB2_GLORO